MLHEDDPYINGEKLRALDPNQPIITKELYTSKGCDGRFSIDNLGRLVLRIMDGTRTLPNISNRLLLGKQYAVRQELEAREWPVYTLQQHEQRQLAAIGLGDVEFPAFIYQLPNFSKYYGHIGSRRDVPRPFPGVDECTSRGMSLTPSIMNMDRSSIELLGEACGLEVSPHEFVGLPPRPQVFVDGKLYSLPSQLQ